MIIGIDIDGVLNDLHYFYKSYGTLFCSKNGLHYTFNSTAYEVKDMFNWNLEQEHAFYSQYYSVFLNSSIYIRPYAQKALKQLHAKHKIIIITARIEDDIPPTETRTMYDITQDWLQCNHFIYDKLILSSYDKKEVIKQENIELMIEDSPYFFQENMGSIPLFCFDTEYNQTVYGPNIQRVYDWYQITSLL